MFGFLLKVLVIAAVTAAIGGVIFLRRGSLPSPSQIASDTKSAIQNLDLSTFGNNLSASLDSLVTHPDKNSPVVLGVKITSDSLNTIVDTLHSLPPDQLSQIQSALCTPASPSAR